MSDKCIDVQHLQKLYRLYLRQADRLKEILLPFGKKRHEDFYALKDITFSLSAGQSLGIIGKNGSGKSTLLKILSGVLTPSAGSVSVCGTVGSLLELGGGFNAELTGRENARLQIMLNGVVEGADEALLQAIKFAELGSFIDQPVKKYSSGMFMRLAFACATAFTPQILIIDEALAVGDTYFVKKCMNRMHNLLASGTSLIFVSHDLESVRHLCRLSLLINQGEQIAFGPTPEVAEQYVALLRMQEQAARCQRASSASERLLPTSDTTDISSAKTSIESSLCDAFTPVQGAVDLAEQRLFVAGVWQWHEFTGLRLVARSAKIGARAAFRGEGNRISLSFLRGGGFALPSVYIDGVRCVVTIENDLVFLSPEAAPLQVRNFTQTLLSGVHHVLIAAEGGPIAWLGGEFCCETSAMLFKDGNEWESALSKRATVYGDREAIITFAELLDFTGKNIDTVVSGDKVRFRIHAKRIGLVKNVSIGYKIHNRLSVGLFGTTTREEQYSLNDTARHWVIEFVFTVPLVGGEYTIAAAIASIDETHNTIHHYVDIAIPFFVQNYPRRTIWGEFYNANQITIDEHF